MNNLIKWSLAFLFAVSGYFVRGWYEDVNRRLLVGEVRINENHTELMVLLERSKIINEKLDLALSKLDKIGEYTK